MTRFSALLLLASLALPVAGCHSATAPAPPLAPGYSSSADQDLGATLAAADAYYNRLQTDSKTMDIVSGQMKFVPTAAERTALNALQASLAVANPLYLAYHTQAPGVTLAQVQAAVDDVKARQAAAQQLTGGN